MDGIRSEDPGYVQENQIFNNISKEVEARLAAKRAARLQARELRKKELNRQKSFKSQQNPMKPKDISLSPHDSVTHCIENKFYADVNGNQKNPSHLNMRNHQNSILYNDEISDSLSFTADSNLSDNISTNGSFRQEDGSADHSLLDMDNLIKKYKDLEKQHIACLKNNTQLNSELDIIKYELETAKDDWDDLELEFYTLKRQSRREHEELLVLKKHHESQAQELRKAKEQIAKRDQLLLNSNLTIVDVIDPSSSLQEPMENGLINQNNNTKSSVNTIKRTNSHGATQTLSPCPQLHSRVQPHLYYQRNDTLSNSQTNNDKNGLDNDAKESKLDLSYLPQILLGTQTIQLLHEFITEECLEESLDSVLSQLIKDKRDLITRINELERYLTKDLTNDDTTFSNEFQTKISLNSTPRKSLVDREMQTFQDDHDIKETKRKLVEYDYKMQRLQQELTTLGANLERSEANCERHKQAREIMEQSESEVKAENRKLKRELRDSKQLVEELESKIGHLERRLEKLRASRLTNAVINELS